MATDVYGESGSPSTHLVATPVELTRWCGTPLLSNKAETGMLVPYSLGVAHPTVEGFTALIPAREGYAVKSLSSDASKETSKSL